MERSGKILEFGRKSGRMSQAVTRCAFNGMIDAVMREGERIGGSRDKGEQRDTGAKGEEVQLYVVTRLRIARCSGDNINIRFKANDALLHRSRDSKIAISNAGFAASQAFRA